MRRAMAMGGVFLAGLAAGSGTFLAKAAPVRKHINLPGRAVAAPFSDAVLVGDSDTDAKTARAANIPVVLVTFGYTETPVSELGAQAVIDHFSGLEAALAQCARA